jgi:type II secretory pathway pseudopilin PulG
MAPRNNARNGYTLVELLLTIGLVGLGIAMLASLLFTFNDTYRRETARVDLYLNTSIVMNEIAVNIQTAKEVLSTQTVNGTAYASSGTEIALSLQSITASGTLNAAQSDYAAYSLNGTELIEDFEANDLGKNSRTRTLSNDIAALSLLYDREDPAAVRSVTVILRAVRDHRGVPIEVNLQRTIKLRN